MSKSLLVVAGLLVIGGSIKLYKKYGSAKKVSESDKMLGYLSSLGGEQLELEKPFEPEEWFNETNFGDKVVVKRCNDNNQKQYWVIDSPKFGRLVVGSTGYVAVAMPDRSCVEHDVRSYWRDANGVVRKRFHFDFNKFKAHVSSWVEGV